MNDPLIARFAEACGAAHPLNLRVSVADGGVLAEGSVQQPFTLIGRDDACDVILNDPEVNPRHAWFQVVGGHVYALDLGSRNGLVWADGGKRSGWLDLGSPVRVGPFKLQLRSPVAKTTTPPGLDPLAADPNSLRGRPVTQLEFRNGKRAKDRWTVNRVITLVGRSETCKLHLHADDISSYHCGLVHTPTGLWVVDLSGRGVVVNGERMRVAPLTHGAELWIGRFLIGCHYPALGETPSASRASHGPISKGRSSKRVPQPVAPTPEDEVPLGGMPVHDPASGLPSSHILCDAFQAAVASGPISAPIFVGSSGPAPRQVPVPPTPRPATPPSSHEFPALPSDSNLAPLLVQLSELHGQMLEQFQHSLVLMAKLLGRAPAADAAVLQKELTRIQELNAELGKLQGDVARQAVTQLNDGKATVTDATPLPGAPPLGAVQSDEAIREWVEQRIGALQKERRHRWEKLNGLVTGDSHEQKSLASS